jgi:hypothetical protein
VKPQLTEGPYFVDERLNRSDLTSDTTNAAVLVLTPSIVFWRKSATSFSSAVTHSKITAPISSVDCGPQRTRLGGSCGLRAVTSQTRVPAMPDLPTVAESVLKGYESSQWYGILAPAGTPEDILNLLNGQVVKIMHGTDMKQRLGEEGVLAVGSTRAEFASHIKLEISKWAKVITQSGARID